MTTKWMIVVIAVVILVALFGLSAAAGDKPADLEEYGSLEVGLGLFFITTPFWAPLALALILLPKRTH